LQRRISKPILDLSKTTETISQKRDYSVRTPVESDDEIGTLARSFNQMLSTIQQREVSLQMASEGMVREIAERRKVEEEVRRLNMELEERVRRRTAELEASNKELEAFSYSVSHDLRAPLRHISGFTQLLEEEIAADKYDEVSRYCKVITDSAKNMGQLIDDLLLFSRMGRAEMKVEDVPMKEITAELIREVQQQSEGRTVHWTVNDLPHVRGDRSLLRLVMQNLLSNAAKYTMKRQNAEIEIGSNFADSEIVFYVRDNGAGFDMRHADKLFGVFQRLHRAEEFEGIGIGLANVRRIIARHGGRTWAEGKVNEGATFYFSLPVWGKQPRS
jgi:light-regulated signal transduction histidine kinase (bacteriophytochrome)